MRYVRKDPALPESVRSDFATICKNISLETRLIDNLLDLTRHSLGAEPSFARSKSLTRYRTTVRHDAGAEFASVNFRELRAEKQDARRVVNPHEHDHHRAGRAEARSDAAGAEIEADEELADREKQRRAHRADPHVEPADAHVWQHFENRREERANDRKGDEKIACLPHGGGERQLGTHVFAQRGEHRTENERDKEQKANREHDRERKKTVAHEGEKRAARLDRDAPNRVERVLELRENRGRAKEQHTQSDDRREHAGRFFRRARLHRGLNRLARACASQCRNLLRDLPTGRFFAKDETGDRNDNYEQGPERKNGVVCERRAEKTGC